MENEKIKRKGRDAWGEMYYQISAGAVGLQWEEYLGKRSSLDGRLRWQWISKSKVFTELHCRSVRTKRKDWIWRRPMLGIGISPRKFHQWKIFLVKWGCQTMCRLQLVSAHGFGSTVLVSKRELLGHWLQTVG
jgi:hypothetical protein